MSPSHKAEHQPLVPPPKHRGRHEDSAELLGAVLFIAQEQPKHTDNADVSGIKRRKEDESSSASTVAKSDGDAET